jgi:hypothetical protein
MSGDSSGLLDDISSVSRAISSLQGVQVRLLELFNANCERSRWAAAELALKLSVSESSAQRQLDLAEVLVNRLPNTLASMEDGIIDSYKASKVADATAFLSVEDAIAVDAQLTSRLPGKNPEGVRRVAGRVVASVDPEGYLRRCSARRSQRELRLQHRGEGMSAFVAELPAEVAAAIYARIDAVARKRKTAGDGKTLDQLRADVFVHIDAATLMALNEDPAWLAGHGAIPAQVARDIANRSGSVWRRIVTDPVDGQIISVGRRRDRPPAALDDLIRIRDRECRHPGCHRPAQACELDHSTPWAAGGPTSARTLVGLCGKHHHLKEQPGWSYRIDDDGSLTIMTPSGAAHRSRQPVAS